jgi:hypothetical protein
LSLQVLQIPNEIAASVVNIKRLENKKFWQRAPENENSHVSHTKTYIQQGITTFVDLNHLPQEGSDNDAREKIQHPLEAI